jgi:hypothetical protein
VPRICHGVEFGRVWEFAHAANSGVELMLSFQSIIAITKFLSIINLSLFFELMAYVYL